MEILSLVLEVRFADNIQLIEVKDNRKLFIETISSEKVQPPPEMTMATQGLQHTHKQTKTLVVLEGNRFAISTELSDIEAAKNRIIEVLKEVFNKFKYKDAMIVRIGVKTTWLEYWNSSFTSLVNRYKKVFYKENEITKEVADVALNFTLKDDMFNVNFISGPMKPEQGHALLVFKERQLPHDFMYFAVDRYDDKKNVENNLAAIKNFVISSLEYGRGKSILVGNLLKTAL